MSNDTLKTKLEIKPTEPPSDHRGSSVKLWDVSNDGSKKEVGLLFQTFKGNMRGGDYHSTTQHNVVLDGIMRIKFSPSYGEKARTYNEMILYPGTKVRIEPLISHVFKAEELNTIMFDQRVQPIFTDPKDSEYWGPNNTRFDTIMRKTVTEFRAITDVDSEKKDYIKINGNVTSGDGIKYSISQGNLAVEIMELEKNRNFEIKTPHNSDYLHLYLAKGALSIRGSSTREWMTPGEVTRIPTGREIGLEAISEEKPILLYWSVKR